MHNEPAQQRTSLAASDNSTLSSWTLAHGMTTTAKFSIAHNAQGGIPAGMIQGGEEGSHILLQRHAPRGLVQRRCG